MTFDEWWITQIKDKNEEMNVPEMWIALRALAKDAWDAAMSNRFLDVKVTYQFEGEAVRKALMKEGWTPPTNDKYFPTKETA